MTDDFNNHLNVLILAGGGGTRLWPKSKEKTPKQFLKLFEKKTLTQITVDRLSGSIPWERMYFVTVSDAYKKEIIREIPSFIPQNIIVEPHRRDTAAAHGLGAMHIYKKDPQAVIITEAADRLVKPIDKYLTTLKKAARLAWEKKVFVLVGVKPRYPHTGLGHIKMGKVLYKDNGTSFFEVEKFVEKPPLELAKKYTASGDYLWNAGQFVWRADEILKAIKKYAPDIYKNLEKIGEVIGTDREDSVTNKSYEAMPKISIDYAVAEKASNMTVVSADFDWTDIGDWNEVWKNLPKDKNNNVIIDGEEEGGVVYNIDSNDSLVQTDGRLIALIDVDNIVVIDTKEALLICPKDKSQNVKKIVEQLKEEGKKELL